MTSRHRRKASTPENSDSGRFLAIRVRLGATIAMAAALAVPAFATAAPGTRGDDSFADFTLGTPSATALVAEPGSVQLKPTGATYGFDGGALPPDFTASAGTPTVESGVLKLDAARVNSNLTYTPQIAVEFRATFSPSQRQHVGLGDDLNNGPWAIFSTGSGSMQLGLYAHTRGQSEPLVPLAMTDPFGPHTYRIEWSAENVKYFVDGAHVASHDIQISTAMKLVAADIEASSDVLSVDWLTAGEYGPSGTYESRVLDAGDPRAVWNSATVTDNTGIALQTRVGNAATPDSTWSGWKETGPGGAIDSSIGRYIQYRAELTRQLNGGTPSLNRIDLDFEIDEVAPATNVDPVAVAGGTATVSFSSSAPDVARYECRLGDSGAFFACSSPQTFAGLAPGSYTLYVRAVDAAGNVGAAVTRSFTVAAPPPAIVPDTTAPSVAFLTRSVRSSRQGDVKLRVKCPAGEVKCVVAMVLKDGRKTVATKAVTIGGGSEKIVKLRLANKTKRKLAARGKLKLKAVITASDHLNNARKTTYGLTVKS